jgi:glycosyltransferase involved in cell wall biosynthesis
VPFALAKIAEMFWSKISRSTKANGFTERNFDKYFDKSDEVSLESIAFKSSLSFNIFKKARGIIKKCNIKNIIYFGASELKSLYFSFIGFEINLIVRHGTTKSTPKKDIFHKLIYSKVNYHVSICKHLQKNVRYIIPFGKNSKEILIYSSIKFEDSKKIKNDKITLVHTGRINRGKGQIDAIKACQVLVDNGIDFIFYIVGGYEKGFEDEFNEFYNIVEYKNKIKLVGFSNEVKRYLDKSDIYIFPSYGEGLSNSFLEALASGTFCISYSNTSFPELKELGFDFNIVENKNIDKLKENLLAIVENKITVNSEKNKKLIKELFSEEVEINKYLEILK